MLDLQIDPMETDQRYRIIVWKLLSGQADNDGDEQGMPVTKSSDYYPDLRNWEDAAVGTLWGLSMPLILITFL